MERITREELEGLFPSRIYYVPKSGTFSILNLMDECLYDVNRQLIVEAMNVTRSIMDQAKNTINGTGYGISYANPYYFYDVRMAHKICKWAKDYNKFLSRKLSLYDRRVELGLLKDDSKDEDC